MKISTYHLNIKFSQLFFFGLFLGYILYNIFILFGLPSFLGGYFGGATLLGFIVFSLLLKSTIKNICKTSLFFSSLVIVSFLWVIIVTLVSILDGSNSQARMQSYTLLITWLPLFCTGFYIVLAEKEKLKKISVFLLILFSFYAVYHVISTSTYMLPFTKGGDVDDENFATYQGIARNLTIIGVFLTAYISSKLKNLACVLMLSALLFLVGARSEFYAYMLITLGYHALVAFKLKSSFLVILTFIVFSAGIAINYYEELQSSRQFNISDLSQDASWALRNEMKEYAIEQIKTHPILGNFGGHGYFDDTQGNSIGSYSHNILSGYQNYGLLFFLSYGAMCFFSFFYSLRKLIQAPKDSDWVFAFLLTFLTAFLIIFSKSVFWQVPYLAWGVFMGVLYKDKFIKIKTRS
jgi:hypothetical protein